MSHLFQSDHCTEAARSPRYPGDDAERQLQMVPFISGDGPSSNACAGTLEGESRQSCGLQHDAHASFAAHSLMLSHCTTLRHVHLITESDCSPNCHSSGEYKAGNDEDNELHDGGERLTPDFPPCSLRVPSLPQTLRNTMSCFLLTDSDNPDLIRVWTHTTIFTSLAKLPLQRDEFQELGVGAKWTSSRPCGLGYRTLRRLGG